MTDHSNPTPSALEQAFRTGHASGFAAAASTSRSQASHVEDAWEEYRHTDILFAPSGSDLDEGVVDDLHDLCARTEADAVSALRYIESRYGRLEGVGWDRVFDAHDELYRRAALCSTPSSTLTPDAGLLESAARSLAVYSASDRPRAWDKRDEAERNYFRNAVRVVLDAATPAIRDQAFEEAARAVKAAIQRAARNIDDAYNRAFDNGLRAAEVVADQAIRALKGTSPTKEPLS